jgi:uncharacterized protein with FMN-binding domain
MHKTLSTTLLVGAAVAVPVGFAINAHMSPDSHAASSTATSTATKKPATHAKATPVAARKSTSSATRTYVGPSVDMQWGPVQVTIVVKGNAVSGLSATAPTERARSAFINNQAIPMLRQEVLQAKTAANIKNIYGISGATLTSEAFYQSLLSALHSARLA